MIRTQPPPRWWLAWHLLTDADRPCLAIPQVQIEALLASVAYGAACKTGNWVAAARALSAMDIYRLLGAGKGRES